MKRRIDLPTLTFGVLMTLSVALLLFLRIPAANNVASVGVENAQASSCTKYCDGWYYCGNLNQKCCNHWHTYCGGGGDQPPTISGTVTCPQPGQNGWCVNNAQLQLTASDPQGYTVTITGDLNGTPFDCGSSSCTLDLQPGTGTANYTATSSTSNLAASGSSTWAYDPNPPSLSSSIAGTAGSNGWYVSLVAITASASDAISGLASLQYSVDGGAWQNGGSASVSSDGTHTVVFRASDNAGNTASESNSIKIDQTKPALTLTVSGTNGLNGWYVSPVTITASASDATSGIASTQYSVDGGSWLNGTSAMVSSDGSHTVQFKTTNNAGLSTTASQSLKIDQTKPVITLTPAGTNGSNGWYISDVNLGISAADAASGLQSSSYGVDGGAPVSNANGVTVPLSDGKHTISVNAADNAGNSASSSVLINVDTTPPTQSLELSGTSGSNGWYISNVQASVNASDATSGAASSTISDNGGAPQSGTITLTTGTHLLTYATTDAAGNTTTASQTVSVDTTLPIVSVAVNGTHGNGNWLISNATVTITASDSVSGIASLAYNVDSTGWHNYSNPLVLADGIHTVQAIATAASGNSATTSAAAEVDTTPPLTSISSPSLNDVVHGVVTISGNAVDTGSGIAGTQISFDEINWNALSSSPTWSYTWNTSALTNSIQTIYARSTDNAGNAGTIAKVGVVVDNNAPGITIPQSWNAHTSGALTVTPNVFPLSSVSIVLDDPFSTDSRTLFSGANPPSQITWDRMMGYQAAAPGNYPLIVEACDIYNVCSQSTSTTIILLPNPATPMPISTRAVDTPQFVRTAAPPARTQTIYPPKQAEVLAPPAPLPPAPVIVWPAMVVGSLVLSFAFLLLFDPRPKAYRSLTKTIQRGVNHVH